MSIYAGIAPEVLTARLAEAQTAYHQLAVGGKTVTARLGDKLVTFNGGDPSHERRLANYIRELQAALGLTAAVVRGVYVGGGKGL